MVQVLAPASKRPPAASQLGPSTIDDRLGPDAPEASEATEPSLGPEDSLAEEAELASEAELADEAELAALASLARAAESVVMAGTVYATAARPPIFNSAARRERGESDISISISLGAAMSRTARLYPRRRTCY